MSVVDPLSDLTEWVWSNVNNLLFSVAVIIVGYFIYKIITRQITRLKDINRLGEDLAFSLSRIAK